MVLTFFGVRPRERGVCSLKTAYRDPMYHQDTKGVWWMPWHRKPMKDVASCDKPCGAASGLGSTDLRMGKPGTGHAVSPAPEHIGCEEGTRGNDTSEYPEENKESLDSLSSGERKGR